jgi:hypothetical protein
MQLFATTAAWQQQQQVQGTAASITRAPALAAAVSVCLAASQDLLPHMSAASIAQLLVCLAILQLVDPGLLNPAAAATADVQLLLDLAVRDLAAGRNRGWLIQQQQQRQQQGALSDVVAACTVLGVTQSTMGRLAVW